LKETFPPVVLQNNPSVKGIKIGIPQEYHSPGLDKQILNAWSKVADLFENAGASVVPVSFWKKIKKSKS
jgi:aspartyl-tRNA(Asn)/glutamyl-tRNA(Gln) amidotransferase subunit A